MSSVNSNNEFDELEDPFGASGVTSVNQFSGEEQEEFSHEEGSFAANAESDFSAPAQGGEDGENPSEPEEEAFPDFAAAEGDAPQAEEGSVEYKKVRCWDMYSFLLFAAWCALLGTIALFWFECDPSQYGDPPYKESSVPVKTAASPSVAK